MFLMISRIIQEFFICDLQLTRCPFETGPVEDNSLKNVKNTCCVVFPFESENRNILDCKD